MPLERSELNGSAPCSERAFKMYRGIAATSLIVSASLVLACSGVALREPLLRALGDDASGGVGPLQTTAIGPETGAGSARPGEPTAEPPAAGELPQGSPEATSPNAGDGHWVFVRSSGEYEARLRTADALAATLAEKLSDTERNAAAQIDAIQSELSGERTRSTDLDRALAQARAGAPARAGGGSVEPAPGASEGGAAQRTALLPASGGSTQPEGAAAAHADASQRRIGEEQARAAELDRALRDARDRLAQDERQKGAADAQAAALVDALASTKAQLADVGREAAKAQELSKALADQRARSADLAHDLSDARAAAAQALQRSAADDGRARAAESAAAAADGAVVRLRSAQDALRAKLADLERGAEDRAGDAREAADGKARLAALEQENARMRGLVAQSAERATAAEAQAATLRDSGDKLAATQQASDLRLGEAQARLGEERAKTAALGKELAVERARAADSERALASAEAGRRSAETSVEQAGVAADGALQASRAATESEHRAMEQVAASKVMAAAAEARATALGRDAADLRDRNAEAERKLGIALSDAKAVAGQRDALRAGSEGDRARATALEAQLVTARTDLARAEAEKAEAVAAGRRGDDAIRDLRRMLSEASASIANLRERAEDAARRRQESATEPEAAKTAPAGKRSREAALGRDPGSTRSATSGPRAPTGGPMEMADHDVAPGAAARPAPTAEAPAPVGAAQPTAGPAVPAGGVSVANRAAPEGLPEAAEPRVSLRYARDDPAALGRAAALRDALRARGIDVATAAPSAASIGGDRVLFYYAEDERSAGMIADGLSPLKPIRGRAEEGISPPPRPGTIEVVIAGRPTPSSKGPHPITSAVFGEARR